MKIHSHLLISNKHRKKPYKYDDTRYLDIVENSSLVTIWMFRKGTHSLDNDTKRDTEIYCNL